MATLHFWLKDEVTAEDIKRLGKANEAAIKIETDRLVGKRYIAVSRDPFDPSSFIPDYPHEYIERVTLKDTIHRGFVPDGVYEAPGAPSVSLLARSFACVVQSKERCLRDVSQDLSANGPDLGSVMTIYTQVREKRLQPKRNWGDEKFDGVTVEK